MTSLRHPRKNRSISIGPQSEADAYEILAFRERRRRESTSSAKERPKIVSEEAEDATEEARYLPTPPSSSVDLNKRVMGDRVLRDENGRRDGVLPVSQTPSRSASQDQRDYENDEREVFSKLEKPRVRYDVEVITKLVVYTGKMYHRYYKARANVEHRHRMARSRG